MRTSIALGAIALTLAFTGCNKDDKQEGPSAAKATDRGGKGGAAPAKATGPRTLTAPEFLAHYMSLQGMAVLDEYGDGVIVSGSIKNTITEGDGSLVVWLDADNGKWVSLGFTDKGAAARTRGVKAGDSVTAQCQVGGAADNYVMNIDCALQ